VIFETYKRAVKSRERYRPIDTLPLTTDFVGGFTDGDGGITLERGVRVLQFSQKEEYVLHRLNHYFGQVGDLRKRKVERPKPE
jgi:hypothetical protein